MRRSLLLTAFASTGIALALTAGFTAATRVQAQDAAPEATDSGIIDDVGIVNVVTLEQITSLLPASLPAPVPSEPEPPVIVPEVIATYPHLPTSFSQGLEFDGDRLFESVGQYGSSDVREVDLVTGEPLQRATLPQEIFAEGLTVVDDTLIQLSWREGVALVWNRDDLSLESVLNYNIEGWGLCYDGERLWQSDGSATLTQRNPETFAQTGFVAVSRAGLPVIRLNELECVDGLILANVWFSDEIMVIDPATGVVTTVIDASGLVPAAERATYTRDQVLNGIAYRASSDTFFLTGKLWPTLYEVRLDLPE